MEKKRERERRTEGKKGGKSAKLFFKVVKDGNHKNKG